MDERQTERRYNLERILIIYDDPESKQTLRRILESAGYYVITTPCGPTAMDVFQNTNPELVVLDLSLPGKPGQVLCRQIRVQSQSVPLLVLSAVVDPGDLVLMLELGADGYMVKPFSPEEFLPRVRAAMRHLIY